MSSTILFSFGSVEVVGGGGVCEVEGAASVASHRELPGRSADLESGKFEKRGMRGCGEPFPLVPNCTGLLAHRVKFTREAERTTKERRHWEFRRC